MRASSYICNTAANGITRNTTITITVLEAVTARNKDVFYECVGGWVLCTCIYDYCMSQYCCRGVVEASYSQALPSFTIQCHPFFSWKTRTSWPVKVSVGCTWMDGSMDHRWASCRRHMNIGGEWYSTQSWGGGGTWLMHIKHWLAWLWRGTEHMPLVPWPPASTTYDECICYCCSTTIVYILDLCMTLYQCSSCRCWWMPKLHAWLWSALYQHHRFLWMQLWQWRLCAEWGWTFMPR